MTSRPCRARTQNCQWEWRTGRCQHCLCYVFCGFVSESDGWQISMRSRKADLTHQIYGKNMKRPSKVQTSNTPWARARHTSNLRRHMNLFYFCNASLDDGEPAEEDVKPRERQRCCVPSASHAMAVNFSGGESWSP